MADDQPSATLPHELAHKRALELLKLVDGVIRHLRHPRGPEERHYSLVAEGTADEEIVDLGDWTEKLHEMCDAVGTAVDQTDSWFEPIADATAHFRHPSGFNYEGKWYASATHWLVRLALEVYTVAHHVHSYARKGTILYDAGDQLPDLDVMNVRMALEQEHRVFSMANADQNSTARENTSPSIEDDDARDFRHSLDFTSVIWFGKPYKFTIAQAANVRMLWEANKEGTPTLSKATLLNAIPADAQGSNAAEVSHLFRGHPAWKTMIVSPKRGIYRLAELPLQRTNREESR